MKVPYEVTVDRAWVSTMFGATALFSYHDYWSEKDRRKSDAILAALIADAAPFPEYVGACLITGSAHGYEFQELALQGRDNLFVMQSWSDLSQPVSERQSMQLDLDIPTELNQIRHDGLHLRSANNRNPNLKSGMEGRYGTIYLAARTDGEWVTCPRLLLGGEYPNTAVNRVFRAMGGLHDQVTLV